MSMEMNGKRENLKLLLEERLLRKLDYSKEATDEEVIELIDNLFLQEEALRIITVGERQGLKQEIFFSLRRLDILQSLLEDNSITEIMINGTDDIFIERAGRIEQLTQCFESQEKLVNVIQRIVAGCNRVVNESSPIVDARLQNGSRVNIVLHPIAINGPVVTIRRFPDKPVTMAEMIQWNSITKEAAKELKLLVRAGYNIFISGGTGSGKTTFLNVLSSFIPADERVITIEDSAELQIQGIPNVVKMEARNENVEGCNAIPIRSLIKTSLRMRPDRIILGEVRGAEAIDLLSAFNTGHDGSMSTGHANSAADMLSRLQTMILMGMELPLGAIKQQIASGIDIMVHLGRMRDKSRKVLEISEVEGFIDGEVKLHTLYQFEEEEKTDSNIVSGSLKKKGALKHDNKLKAAGLTI